MVVLLLVMDPVGNVPLFVSSLRKVEPQRRMRVMARECLIVFAVLLVFAVRGNAILDLFGISDPSLPPIASAGCSASGDSSPSSG